MNITLGMATSQDLSPDWSAGDTAYPACAVACPNSCVCFFFFLWGYCRDGAVTKASCQEGGLCVYVTSVHPRPASRSLRPRPCRSLSLRVWPVGFCTSIKVGSYVGIKQGFSVYYWVELLIVVQADNHICVCMCTCVASLMRFRVDLSRSRVNGSWNTLCQLVSSER